MGMKPRSPSPNTDTAKSYVNLLFRHFVPFLPRGQHGQCSYCGPFFKPGDMLDFDHLIPPRFGGDDRLMNLQILHRHCHDQKTAKLDAAQAAEHAQVSVTRTI
jgi:5-methylcytosine-specific restriction endonuclease McrA